MALFKTNDDDEDDGDDGDDDDDDDDDDICMYIYTCINDYICM